MNRTSRPHDTNVVPVSPSPSRFLSRILGALLLGGLVLGHASDADACSGEAYTVDDPVKISAHETAMAMSHTGSSMWVRVEFDGNPKEFGLVIPAPRGSTIGLAEPEFFDTLRASTGPIVRRQYTSSGGGCGCGSAGDATAGDANVQVVSSVNVGPYAAVTLRSTDADALGVWLRANGFQMDPSVNAALQDYVAEELDFLAIKFRPGVTVTKLPPLRVDTPTHDMRVLLRMAQSGARAQTDMVLYVLSDERVRPQNFPETTLDPAGITFDRPSGKSNYDAASRKVMALENGRTWITEFAGELSASAYLSACRALKFENTSTQAPPNVQVDDASVDAPLVPNDAGGDAADGGSVQDASTVDAQAGGDASAQSDDAGVSEVPSAPGACNAKDLLRRSPLGTTGVYVTRLRASLPKAALVQDLVLERHPTQTDVSNVVVAAEASTGANISGRGVGGQGGTFLLVGFTALALTVVRRRAKP